jgi:hypothetical protein
VVTYGVMRRFGVAVTVLLAAVLGFLLVRRWRRPDPVATVRIVDPEHSTTMDARGAVTSIQAAELTLSESELDRVWTPEYLERLARTYWRFLSRATLGLIRVAYTERERYVVLLTRPFVLLAFQAPEYEIDDHRGVVRWRIEDGILVSERGKGGDGYLDIDVQRRPSPEPGKAVAHVEVEVAYFYPAIAEAISRRVYKVTQSFVHVLVTHAFLRSLARGDLAESRVGRMRLSVADAGHGAELRAVVTGADPPDGPRA